MQPTYPLVVPAIMADEWESLVAQVEVIAPVVQRVQIDVMDGHLVPSISFPYNKTMLSDQQFPHGDTIHYDVHLMVQHPQEVGHRFIEAGANTIIAQIEGFRESEAEKVFIEWKEKGVETGVSLLLDTPLEKIESLVESDIVSLVQVMSIARIGYQGESFDTRALDRISLLKNKYPDITIAVDGGVKHNHVSVLIEKGAALLGVGSAIMKAENPTHAFTSFEEALKS